MPTDVTLGTIRLVIVDDHAIVRAGLAELLSSQGDIQVVGEASDGRGAIELVRTRPVDALVLDVAMPGHSGLDAIGRLRAKAPDMGIVILSGHAEELYAPALLAQGADAYLNKCCEPREIVVAIRAAASGARRATPRIERLLDAQAGASQARPHERLSVRELQVVLRVARGEKPARIAADLSLSAKTVSNLRALAMRKLGLATSSELAAYAVRSRLID